MDSYFITTATVVGCILLVVLLGLVSNGTLLYETVIAIYLAIAIVASVLGILVFVYLRKVYDTSMLNYRLARSKRKSMLDGIEF
jgi:heme/copper-type cytochrome/quinol oxidase subunit 4